RAAPTTGGAGPGAGSAKSRRSGLEPSPAGPFTASDVVIIDGLLWSGLRGRGLRDAVPPHAVGERHAGPVGEVDRGGGVEHVQIGAGADPEVADVGAAQ